VWLCIHWVVRITKQHPFLIHANNVCLHYLHPFLFYKDELDLMRYKVQAWPTLLQGLVRYYLGSVKQDSSRPA